MGMTGGRWGLALVALALRLLLVPGWMPVMGQHGVTVTLCTAEGAVRVALPGKDPVHKAHDPCPFAVVAIAPLLPDVIAPLLPQIAARIAPLLAPRLDRPHIGAPAPPPPPTGPPAPLG